MIQSRKKTNNQWFETQDSINYWDDFSRPKIVWGNLCLNSQFAFVSDEVYINAPASMIVPGDKYLLGILNSKLANWYIRSLGVTRNGGFFEYKPMFVEQLPVPVISGQKKEEIIKLVDNIIDEKKANSDCLYLEDKLDNIIFQLYGLTTDEINFIKFL